MSVLTVITLLLAAYVDDLFFQNLWLNVGSGALGGILSFVLIDLFWQQREERRPKITEFQAHLKLFIRQAKQVERLRAYLDPNSPFFEQTQERLSLEQNELWKAWGQFVDDHFEPVSRIDEAKRRGLRNIFRRLRAWLTHLVV
jgi:hypothetical protein